MAKPTCAWLTVAFLAGLLPVAAMSAGRSGTVFRSVAVGDCLATGPEKICLNAPLTPGATTTALDVLRDIYPGLRANGMGHRFAGGEAVEAASDPDTGKPADRAVDISTRDFADVAVIGEGGKVYAAAVSGGVVTMAEVKPAYRPLGRLLVATDPGGPTNGYRLLLAAPGSPVAVTLSSHFNSQEGFDAFHMVGVVGGELVDLYDGPYLYSQAEMTERCDLLDHRELVAAFETRKRKQQGFADIGIVIDYAATCLSGEDSRPVENRSFPIRLTFDGSRYDGDSSALDDFNARFAE